MKYRIKIFQRILLDIDLWLKNFHFGKKLQVKLITLYPQAFLGLIPLPKSYIYEKYVPDKAMGKVNMLWNLFRDLIWSNMTIDLETSFKVTAHPLKKGTLLMKYDNYGNLYTWLSDNYCSPLLTLYHPKPRSKNIQSFIGEE